MKKKVLAIILLQTLLVQLLTPMLSLKVLAADETQTDIPREYEVKNEETWDVSESQDGSVIAKWKLEDKSITISGNGDMKDWEGLELDYEDWHMTQYTSIVEKVVIENGITSIGAWGFANCSSLETIEIPESVIDIDGATFYGCSSLKSVRIPEKVTNLYGLVFFRCTSLESIEMPPNLLTIGASTFKGCSSLKEIEIPSSVTEIGIEAFEGCSSLKSVKIPEKVTTIATDMFFGCSSLESIEIPESVIGIDTGAFSECTNLKQIELPEKLEYIGNELTLEETGAFLKCTSLKTIKIPDSVTRIGKYTFKNCIGLESIEVEENNAIYSSVDGVLYNKDKTNLICYPPSKEGSNYTILDTVTKISEYAFFFGSKLANLKIPDTVTGFYKNSFYGLEEKITMGGGASGTISVTLVSEFENYKNLMFVDIKADSAAHSYFEDAKKPYILEGEASEIETKYQIKNTKTWDISEEKDESIIANWNLEDRSITISGVGDITNWGIDNIYTKMVETIVIENGITKIETDIFSRCSSLEDIKISETVTNIEEIKFGEYTSLRNINVDENNSEYSDIAGVLYNKDKTTLICCPPRKEWDGYIVPESVTIISANAFNECSTLKNIEIIGNVTSIGNYAFRKCNKLEEIQIPEDVTTIETGTFMGCTNLKKIEIPSSVTTIGEYAFSSCTSLEEVEIPEGITTIEPSTFFGCTSLKKVNIPSSVISIGNSAFSNCTSLEEIQIPEGITTIESSTFSGCSSLKNINIPSGVTNIGYSAFNGCTSLEYIILPDSIENIVFPDNIITMSQAAIDRSIIVYTKTNSSVHKGLEENIHPYILDDEGPQIYFDTTEEEVNIPKKVQNVKVRVEDDAPGINQGKLMYKWTQEEQQLKEEDFIESFTNEEYIEKSDGDGAWYLWILAKDKTGKTSIQKSPYVVILDNTLPQIFLTYSTVEPEQEKVEVTITSDEEIQEVDGWEISEDKKILTKEYTKNTQEEITIKDIAENEVKMTVTIENIKEESTEPKITKGDINQDGEIDTVDILRMLRQIAATTSEQIGNKHPDWILLDNEIAIADINEDGMVDTVDLLIIQRHVAASKSEEIAEKHPDWLIENK